MTARASYRDVGEATRAAIDRAIRAAADKKINESALVVVLAAVHLLSSYSKLADEVSRDQIAAVAGLSQRQASRHLATLARAQVIGWSPGGNGRPSLLSLLPGSGTSRCLTTFRVAGHAAPSSETSGGQVAGHPRVRVKSPSSPREATEGLLPSAVTHEAIPAELVEEGPPSSLWSVEEVAVVLTDLAFASEHRPMESRKVVHELIVAAQGAGWEPGDIRTMIESGSLSAWTPSAVSYAMKRTTGTSPADSDFERLIQLKQTRRAT